MVMRRVLLTKEFYLAVFTLTLGAWCLDQTRDLSGNAWTFPFYLSVALCLLGGILMVQCVLDQSERTIDMDTIHAVLQGALPIAAIAGLWTLALNLGFGYLLPSVVSCYAMMRVLHFGTPWQRLSRAVVATLIIFTMFYLLFDCPLPVLESVDDFFSAISEMMR